MEQSKSKAACRVVDAIFAMRGAVELIYTHSVTWEEQRQNTRDGQVVRNVVEVEKQLRQVSKLLPLQALKSCDDMKQAVFMEAPVWTMWGLDKLDRKCTNFMPEDASTFDCGTDVTSESVRLLLTMHRLRMIIITITLRMVMI